MPRIADQSSLEHKAPLSRTCSTTLDLLRFAAAVTVFLSHLLQGRFSIGRPFLVNEGHLAVAVFFVLSGFVIRYVTLTRETTAGEYLIDRASRIYSVVIPALAITVFCELAARAIHPHYYALLREPFSWRHVPFEIVANLAFQAENWGYSIHPLSNGPFWSLSFECLYYAIYGLLFFRVRNRTLWCCMLFLLAGPAIALMFPVWLMGAYSYDLYRKLYRSRRGLIVLSAAIFGIVVASFAAHTQIRSLLILTDENRRTMWITGLALHLPFHHLLLSNGVVPWLVAAPPSYFFAGAATAAVTLWVALFCDYFGWEVSSRITRVIRIVADSTFALYLLHVPLLILVSTLLGRQMTRDLDAVVFLAIILCCVYLAKVFDDLKRSMRGWMRRLLTA